MRALEFETLKSKVEEDLRGRLDIVERRVVESENRAAGAEHRVTEAEKKASDAETQAAGFEQRAIQAETRVAELECERPEYCSAFLRKVFASKGFLDYLLELLKYQFEAEKHSLLVDENDHFSNLNDDELRELGYDPNLSSKEDLHLATMMMNLNMDFPVLKAIEQCVPSTATLAWSKGLEVDANVVAADLWRMIGTEEVGPSSAPTIAGEPEVAGVKSSPCVEEVDGSPGSDEDVI